MGAQDIIGDTEHKRLLNKKVDSVFFYSLATFFSSTRLTLSDWAVEMKVEDFQIAVKQKFNALTSRHQMS